VPAVHHRWARYLGRAATGVLFVIGGALVHVTNLVTGVDYTGFADPAHFWWVTQAWHAVVAPHQVLFIGLLAVFECAAGILVGVVAAALDDPQLRAGDTGGERGLMLGREQEVVASGQDQRRYPDLPEPVHDGPTVEQFATGEDEGLWSHLRVPFAMRQLTDHGHLGMAVV